MKTLPLLTLFASLAVANAVTAATFSIVNMDGAGEGLNDTTAFVPVGGNTATTLGAARLAVLQEAGRVWGAQLTSAIAIVVEADFGPLDCTANSATLGSAGPMGFVSNFPGAPLPNVAYPLALANAISGTNIFASNDISASFNSDIGGTSCLAGKQFYLGFDHALPNSSYVDLLNVALHELGHGLGFVSATDSSGNSEFVSGRFSVYAQFIYSDTLGRYWTNMTAAERAANAASVDKLVWNGANVNGQLSLLTGGLSNPGGYLMLYAPSTYSSGSSVSHWDLSAQWIVGGATRSLLMEPFISANPLGVTDFTGCVLRDIGWQGTRCVDSSGVVPALAAAVLTSPTPSTTLTSATATFGWSAGTGVTQYWLYVGSAQGTYDVYNGDQGTNLSKSVSNLPTDGRTLYVRIYSWITDRWQFNDYSYTAATIATAAKAVLTSPSPGSTLTSATATFGWSAGTGVTQYWLYVGSAQGTYDVYNGDQGTNLSKSVSNLPTDGRTLYVRIYSWTTDRWQFNDYSYTAATTSSVILNWTAPTVNDDGTALTDLAGYRIAYGTDINSLTQLIDDSSPTATSYTISDLASGTWYFTIRSYTTAGAEGVPSNAVSKTL